MPSQGDQLAQVAVRLRKLSSPRPRLAIVLGSGFQSALHRLRVSAEIPYSSLPGFPAPSVDGHAGKLLIGHLAETEVLVLSGRAHFYEGHSMELVTFPIRALAQFGIKDLLLTNAAGGINRKFRPGDLMLLTDHINFMPVNPLRGEVPEGCQRFIDLTHTYDEHLNQLLVAAAKRMKLPLKKGIYIAVPGPCYETPAEIRAFARLGADAIGMSTVPEAIVARQYGLAVAGLSCITNLAAGRASGPLSHLEVLAVGQKAGESAANLLHEFARQYS